MSLVVRNVSQRIKKTRLAATFIIGVYVCIRHASTEWWRRLYFSQVQRRIDAWHRKRFRKHIEVVYESCNWQKPVDSKPDAEEFTGWMREFKQYIDWRGESYAGDVLYANDKRVFTAFYTVPGIFFLRFMSKWFPRLNRYMFQMTANLSMRWIVDCDIKMDPDDETGSTQMVDVCQFRKQLGESACRKYCKVPTERFMHEECGVHLQLVPGENYTCRFSMLNLAEKNAKHLTW